MSPPVVRADSSRTNPRPAWLAAWPTWTVGLAFAAGTALVTVCFLAPRFWLWPVAGLPLGEFVAIQPEFHRAFHVLRQLADPWQRIDDPVNRVIEWRLLWPLVGRTLGLPPAVFLALPHLGCLVALAAVAATVWRLTHDVLPTAAATLLAATASWFFVSTGWLAYFDSWLVLALVLASFGRPRWLLFASGLLAPWIDERFLFALPLCLAVRALGIPPDLPPGRRALLHDAALLLAGVAPYLALRLGLELSGLRATSGAYWGERPLLPASLLVTGWGAWNGLRLGWVALALAVVALPAPRPRLWLALAAATLAVNLCVADDLSRSVSVGVPLVLAAVLILWHRQPARARRLLPVLCAGNLLLPAHHIIAAPGTAAAWHFVPVLSLPAECERARQPPDFAHPEVYQRRSLDHLQGGRLDRALAAAETGLRFDPHRPKSIANFGIVQVLAGRRTEGLANLDRALALAPDLYDARLQRAAFRQQNGDSAGALADVREALRLMPPDWPRRAEAEKFARALAAGP
jgi:tetratricopeptide (TPR) repeat protein